MKHECIEVKGAREHNLKGIDLKLPKRRLIVMTGPSGSGKSSMAFDTIFSEGRRRYLDSLSVYARQFIGEVSRPDVEDLRGLGPTIAIDQKTAGHNPRSTVGTITEIYDFMRVLWSNVGIAEEADGRLGVDALIPELRELPTGTKLVILAPLVRNRKGMFKDLLERLRRAAFTRVMIDGEMRDLNDDIKLRKTYKHDIDVVIDRLKVKKRMSIGRLRESLELALDTAEGSMARVEVTTPEGGLRTIDVHADAVDQGTPGSHGLSPQCFSFNSPLGMCPRCQGLGITLEMDAERVIADPSLSIHDGAVAPWSWRRNKVSLALHPDVLQAVLGELELDPSVPFETLTKKQRKQFLFGIKRPITVNWARGGRSKMVFEGALAELMRHFRDTNSEILKDYLSQFVAERRCAACEGTRLNDASRAVKINGLSIADLNELPVCDAVGAFEGLTLTGNAATIAAELVPEIIRRLRFLDRVGLGYLQLSRSGPTLSGGESQRIRLATQLGSGLTGVTYILDEPSIGLHPRDHRRLLASLEQLRDQGNTIIVVEHDSDTMRAADYLVDFGPGAGVRGGELMYAGSAEDIGEAENSLTSDYLTGRRRIEVPAQRRPHEQGVISIVDAAENNLAGLDIDVPLGVFTCVTGVSGAGKSTLVNSILYPAASNVAARTQRAIGACEAVTGLDVLDRVIAIDQKPIGRTPRSNPATYTKVFDLIRKLYASMPESKIYGYKPGRFSFNVKGGRCETCQGAGTRTLEMQFLTDVYIPCEDCGGKRFNDATLRIHYQGLSIADVLDMNIHDALEVFAPHPKIARILQTLVDVGLGYLSLGQPSPTLSGGEAQRIKLSRELARPPYGHTLYVLDEPSTGLHFEDIRHLLGVINRLVDANNTVVVIEHNLDIIKSADHLIDLGPEGGAGGGQLVAEGTPEAVAEVEDSHTGRALREVLMWAREAAKTPLKAASAGRVERA